MFDRRVQMRVVGGVVALLLSAGVASAQVVFTPNQNPPSLRFPAGPDFATDVLGDPWDFSNAEDLGPDPMEFGGWSEHAAATLSGTAAAFLQNGTFRGTATGGDPQMSLLYRGGYDVINPIRNGIRYPIATANYKKVAVRVTYGAGASTGEAVLFWFFYPNGHPNTTFGASILGSASAGTRTLVVDLAAVAPWVGAPWSSEQFVRGFRLDPTSQSGNVDIAIDWVRLTTADGSSAANMRVDVSCNTGWSVVAIDAGGETPMLNGSGNASSIGVNYGVLPPGSYNLGLRCGAGALQASTAFSVNAPATVRVTSPGPTTGVDFASTTLANGAWDMAQDADIAGIGNVAEPGFVSSSTGRDFRARNLGDRSAGGGDPIVYLMAEPNNSTPIATTRYRYLTYTMAVDGAYSLAPPDGGSVTRILWSSSTSSSLTTTTNSQDILLWPGRNTYTVDLARLTTTPDPIEGTGIETECVAVGCPTARWTSGSARFLRIDPHESPVARFFQLGKVSLTAMPEVTVGGVFAITYRNSDQLFNAGSDSHRVRIFADTDTNANTPGIPLGTVSGLTPLAPSDPDRSFDWTVPASFAPGVYYVYAEITDVTTGEIRGGYSEVPVRVYVPGSTSVQINMVKPTSGGKVYTPFTITGCASNPGASGNSGVDDIQISVTASNNVENPIQRGATFTLGESPATVPWFGTKQVNLPCPLGDAAYAQSGYSVTNISGLSAGTWTLRVVARDAVDGQITETSFPFMVEWKAAPARNLRLSSVNGGTVSFVWDPPNEGGPILAYRIQISASSTFQSLLTSALVAPTVTSGSGALPNGVWYIRIVTLNTYSNDGEPSNVLSLVMPGGGAPVAPGAPTLTAAQVTSNPISLTWAAGTGGAPSSYTLFAGTSPGGSELGGFPLGTATSISAAAPIGLRIYVRVVASNPVGSATSNEINFQLSTPTPPGAPTMNAPVVSAGRTVTLSWTASSSGSTPASYLIEARFSPTGPVIATLSVTATSTSVPNVPPGTYFVSVRAANAAGTSGASNQVTAVVP